MADYMSAIAITDPDRDTFDPKVPQKAVYKWYDSRYSDDALDIYSEEWQDRIIFWHQRALENAAITLGSEDLMEKLDFGNFFLAHPIAAFSLWQVLQACYDLDRAVCGNTADDFKEMEAWEQMLPFRYLRDEEVLGKWQESLELLKEQIKSREVLVREAWELRMYDILLGVERFENAFECLKENFSVNLDGENENSALWMITRIEDDIGKRFSMIDRLLAFKDSELANMRPTESSESHESSTTTYSALEDTPVAPPRFTRRWTFRNNQNRSRAKRSSAVEQKKHSPGNVTSVSHLKLGVKAIKSKYRKHKGFVVKSLKPR